MQSKKTVKMWVLREGRFDLRRGGALWQYVFQPDTLVGVMRGHIRYVKVTLQQSTTKIFIDLRLIIGNLNKRDLIG